jgi:hypothetical protein
MMTYEQDREYDKLLEYLFDKDSTTCHILYTQTMQKFKITKSKHKNIVVIPFTNKATEMTISKDEINKTLNGNSNYESYSKVIIDYLSGVKNINDIEEENSKENKKEILYLKFSNNPKGNLNFPYKNILFKGVPGTGKSRAIDNIIKDELNIKNKKKNILRINIHSASSNSDLMQGIGISTSENGSIKYSEKQGLILDIIKRATFHPNQPFALILEEIQENSLNELIGDLIYPHRIYNNFVGYYAFKQNNTIYKLMVLPKSIDIKSESKEKDFVNYLLHYHRVNNKYSFDKTKNIEDSLLSLAFKNNNDEKNSHLPLEEFEFYKYKSILENIDKFFKKHKNYKRIRVDYSSQSVKYKLNVQKNIKELDKTRLHQTRSIDMMYSLISTITYYALKLFMTNKLNDFDDEKKKILLSQCKNINSFIVKKYNLDRGYKLSLSKLNSFKIEKVFKSTNETKNLLIRIKSLFGSEQMYDDTYISVHNRYDLNTTSFFIDPILFYEWYVYDILKRYADENGKIILFDKCKKRENKTTTKYELISNKKPIAEDSKPDFILVDEKEKIKIIIDAKWKNIKCAREISSSDYLKLKLDSSLLKKDSFSTSSYLVYPSIGIDAKHLL